MSHPFGEKESSRTPEGENLDIVSEQAAFLQEVATLIATLPGEKQPDKEDHTFGFTILPFSSSFELPKALKSEASHIDDLFIYIGDAHKAETAKESETPAYLSIDFNAGTDIYQISSAGLASTDEYALYKFDSTGYKHPELDEAFTARYSHAGVITKAELNAFLMSIVYPSAIHDYSAYADKDLQSSEAFESLCELLSRKALTQSDSYYFVFDNKEIDFYFTKENGQTTSFTLHYYDERRLIPISIEYDIGIDSSLRFFTIVNGLKKAIMPTAEEVNTARFMLLDELEHSEPVLFKRYKGEIIEPEDEPIDPEYALSNELSALVDTALDELGLNPPNPGA